MFYEKARAVEYRSGLLQISRNEIPGSRRTLGQPHLRDTSLLGEIRQNLFALGLVDDEGHLALRSKFRRPHLSCGYRGDIGFKWVLDHPPERETGFPIGSPSRVVRGSGRELDGIAPKMLGNGFQDLNGEIPEAAPLKAVAKSNSQLRNFDAVSPRMVVAARLPEKKVTHGASRDQHEIGDVNSLLRCNNRGLECFQEPALVVPGVRAKEFPRTRAQLVPERSEQPFITDPETPGSSAGSRPYDRQPNTERVSSERRSRDRRGESRPNDSKDLPPHYPPFVCIADLKKSIDRFRFGRVP